MTRFRGAMRATAPLCVAALLLAACADDDPDDATEETTDEVATGATEETTDGVATEGTEEPGDDGPDEQLDGEPGDEPEPGPEELVAVRVWLAFTDGRLDWVRQIADGFNQQLDSYAITVEGVDAYETLHAATQEAADAGQPPAIVQHFEATTAAAADAVDATGAPLYTSIESALDGRDEVLGVPVALDDLVDAARNAGTLDGELRSVAWTAATVTLFSNTTMLEAYEVDVPATWQDLEEACEDILASDDPPSACITWPNHAWITEQAIASQDGVLADNDNGRSGRATELDLESDAMLDWLDLWKQLEDDGAYLYTGTERDWAGTYDAFVTEQVPFILYSSIDTGRLTEDGEEAGFEVETAFFPVNADADDGGYLVGGGSLWLTNGLDPQVEDVALAFLNHLVNADHVADWHRQTGYLPVTNAAIDLLEDEGWFDDNPNARTASDQLAAAPDSPATAGAAVGGLVAIRDVITEAIHDILVDDLDPAERMAEAQTSAQDLLDEFNAEVTGG